MIKSFNFESKTIASGAIIIAGATLVSKIFGLIRERIFAGQFGAGDIMDIYQVAFRAPDFVFNLLVLGAISAGFIPVFTGYLRKGKEDQRIWDLANNLLNIMMVGLIAVCAFLAVITPFLIPLIAPGFSQEKIQLAVGMTRIMFLSPIFLGISSIIGGILNSFRRFFIYSLAPIFYNIGIIIGVLFFYQWWGIYGLAIGVAFGAFLHLAVQIPAAYQLGFRWKNIFDFSSPGIRQITKMMVPRTLALAISQINLLAITIIASTLASGSIAVFHYANNLQSFPLSIVGISFSIAAFPLLSSRAADKKTKEFLVALSSTVRQILFLLVPASVLIFILRAQIVRVILGTGNFDWTDTKLTLSCLGVFSFSLFAQALIPLFARAFFAYQDARTPFFAGLASVSLNIILALSLVSRLGIVGLVLAFSISSIFNLVLLYLFLRIKIGFFDEKNIFQMILKIVPSSLLAGFFSWKILYLIEPFLNTRTGLGILIQALIAGFAGIGIYFICCYLLKVKEIFSLKNLILRSFVNFK